MKKRRSKRIHYTKQEILDIILIWFCWTVFVALVLYVPVAIFTGLGFFR